MSSNYNWWTGNAPQTQQLTQQTPEQQQLMKMLSGALGGATGSGMEWLQQILSGDPEAMAKFEAPMMRQFEQQTVPGIAERFAGAGSGGAMSSSAMNQSMGQAGRELQENLAAMRGGLQQNALTQLQGLLGIGFQPTFENLYTPGTQGFLGGAAQGFAQGAGQAAGAGIF